MRAGKQLSVCKLPFKALLLVVDCAAQSPGELVEVQILILQAGAALLLSVWVMLLYTLTSRTF